MQFSFKGKISFLHSDTGDWVGVYVNDELIYEGHNVDARMLIKLLTGEWPEYKEVNLSDLGRCPDVWPAE